jgi:hypothetical protein
VYVDYWWFLRYNDFPRAQISQLCANRLVHAIAGRACPEHEGDWEGVTAVTARGDPGRLEYVQIAAHESVLRYPRDRMRSVAGDRPVVYVAHGSHAGYVRPCPPDCQQINSPFPDGHRDGNRSWMRNPDAACGPDAECLKPFPSGSWMTYRGRWGARECESLFPSCRLAAAPLTPARQQRYRTPWCYVTEGDKRLRCDTE